MTTRSTRVLTGFSPPVPDAVAQRAAAYPTGSAPAEPAPSASVVLLRDGPEEPEAGGGRVDRRAARASGSRLEVYLLHRHARMPFAPSVAVFPGGRMDPADQDAADPWRACGRRETEEETGVALEESTLAAWAHWVTPECEPLRFDTRFYVAALPAGQQAEDVSGETDRAAWVGVEAALEQRERGELALMPPTWSILVELAGLPDVAAVLDAAVGRRIETVLPRLVPTVTGWAFEYEVLDP